jgi:hypothetical protein
MKSKSLRSVCVALIALAAVGCQSGPRWAQVPQRLAWWKKDTVAADNSLAARAADGVTPAEPAPPVLPSTLATPQSLTAAATPPSANSVAAVSPATATAVAAPPFSTIPTMSAATIAAAPTAVYPTTAATQPIPSSVATVTIPTVTIPNAAPTTASAQAGPYDPSAYQTATVATVPAGSPAQTASGEADRYATTSTGAADDRYAFNPATAPQTTAPPTVTPNYTPPASDDRYGGAPTPSAATTATPATNPATPSTPPFVPPPITPIGPQSNAPANSAETVAAAIVRIDVPAGQYRPGGTSSYSGVPTTSIEVASRPTTVAPAPTATPLPSNVPIYPTGNTRVRTF